MYRNIVLPVILLLAMMAGCGYHNPHVYHGPGKTIFLTNWKNRTNELGLDAQLYHSLHRWFERAGSITLTKVREEADLVLAGEVVSLTLPSRAYDDTSTATEVRLSLRVRYVLQDRRQDSILLEEPGGTWTDTYLVADSAAGTRDNQHQAIATIIDDITEGIYIKTLATLGNQ